MTVSASKHEDVGTLMWKRRNKEDEERTMGKDLGRSVSVHPLQVRKGLSDSLHNFRTSKHLASSSCFLFLLARLMPSTVLRGRVGGAG